MTEMVRKATIKDKVAQIVWQHMLLLVSLYFMTLGVALSVRSGLGSGAISTIPMVLAIAGTDRLVPGLTIGEYTNFMNFLLVGLQILILRRRFEPIQLLQLIIGFIFGLMLDINMTITGLITYDSFPLQVAAQLGGATILGIAIAFEIKCGSVTMPGEGIQVAISRVTGAPFPKIKICVDTSLVLIAAALGVLFYGEWLWNVVGPGTLFAMIYVGFVVRLITPHIRWFDSVVAYRPGFRRYIYGLARYLYRS